MQEQSTTITEVNKSDFKGTKGVLTEDLRQHGQGGPTFNTSSVEYEYGS